MRILNAALEALLSLPEKRAILMVGIAWPSGTVRAHEGIGPINWNGHTWYGVGEFGRIGMIEEGTDAGRLQLELATADVAQLNEALRDDAAGSEVRVYLAGLNASMQLQAAQLIYFGYVNNTPVSYDPRTIGVDCVGVEHRWNRPKQHTRYNAACQRALYPNDSYCDDVENVAKGPLSSYSGGQSVGGGGRGGGGGGKWQYR